MHMKKENEYIEVNPNDCIVCVNITKTFKSKMRECVYDCARGYWKVDLKNTVKVDGYMRIIL